MSGFFSSHFFLTAAFAIGNAKPYPPGYTSRLKVLREYCPSGLYTSRLICPALKGSAPALSFWIRASIAPLVKRQNHGLSGQLVRMKPHKGVLPLSDSSL